MMVNLNKKRIIFDDEDLNGMLKEIAIDPKNQFNRKLCIKEQMSSGSSAINVYRNNQTPEQYKNEFSKIEQR